MSTVETAAPADHARPPWPTLREATRQWLRIGLISFGGPAGQIALMHRLLVEERRWISNGRFLHALNYCMLLPGPEAQQLVTYVGWLLHGTAGGVIAGVLFILPGALAVLALSIAYALWGGVPLIAGFLFGLKAAVLALVLAAIMRIGRRALRTPLSVGIAVAAFLALFVFGVSFPLVIVGAGLVGFSAHLLGLRQGPAGHGAAKAVIEPAAVIDGSTQTAPPTGRVLRLAGLFLVFWLLPVAVLLVTLGDANTFSRIAVFFSQLAVVTFGGAYAVLAYVAEAAVETFAWLSPGEMVDGLGLAETTPGPLILVLEFVGFLAAYRDSGGLDPMLAGILGAVLATFVTFAPCFFFIFLGAPFIERLRSPALSGALSAITAAVVGVIANLALWFGLHTLFAEQRTADYWGLQLELPVLASLDPWALALAVAAGIALIRFNAPVVATIAAAATAGALISLL